MTVSAVGLAILTPLLLWVLGGAIGGSQAEVVARLGRPLPAAVLALFAVVGMRHWMRGTAIMVDDYVHGPARAWVLIAVQVFGWAVIALALIALARMALVGIVVV